MSLKAEEQEKEPVPSAFGGGEILYDHGYSFFEK